jgi:DNA-binding PadR family transcriptional regulator
MLQAETAEEPPEISLTEFQQNIHTMLAEEPRYGLAVKRELRTYYYEEVNHGHLYPTLDELVELGLVEKRELEKRTNEYWMTEDGFCSVRLIGYWIRGRAIKLGLIRSVSTKRSTNNNRS